MTPSIMGAKIVNREELLRAVEHLYAGGGNEDEDIVLIEQLRAAFPHSKISDLIFWDPAELTPEQVVDEVLRREAIHALGNTKAEE